VGEYDHSSTLADSGALSEERIVGPAIVYYYYLLLFVTKAPYSNPL
jgi:hypothetical protein